MSQDFVKQCNLINIDSTYFYEVSFGKINTKQTCS